MKEQQPGCSRPQEVNEALHQLLDLLADRVAERLIAEHRKRTRHPRRLAKSVRMATDPTDTPKEYRT